ncbi:MAG: hypothetical protein PHF72_07145 [Gammaproteobacteria bacterium]|nr:hypothetical protein [Gammaproteobacteria bacterium]
MGRFRFAGLCLAVVLASLAVPQRTAATPAVELESYVIFNTRCADCHEGECSGRLSFFHLPEDAADEHVRRFAGQVPVARVRELQFLLTWMKKNCAFYPLPLVIPADGRWDMKALASLSLDSGRAYFVPIGELAPGRWRVTVGAETAADFTVEVVGSDFEPMLAKRLSLPGGGRVGLRFDVQKRQSYYLRLEACGGMRLAEVTLEPVQ